MSRISVFTVCVMFAALLTGTPAQAQPTGLEYRLKAAEGEGDVFAYDHGDAMTFARRPFMSGKDFASVAVRKGKHSGEWMVELTTTAAGRKKFIAIMKSIGGKEFCLVFHDVVQACDIVTFDAETVNAAGAVVDEIYGRAKAERLAARMRGEIARRR